VVIIDAADVAALFDMRTAFEATARAARLVRHPDAATPARTPLHMPNVGGEALVMPGALPDGAFGLKLWYTLEHPNGLPSTTAMILVVDPVTGSEALVDAAAITDLRTGAMTGLAAQALAPADATTATVIGAGIQARTQILAIAHALPALRTVRVSSRNPHRRDAFVSAIADELACLHPERDLHVLGVAEAEAAVTGADVVVAATTSATPVVQDRWLKDDALVCSVGSHAPAERELEAATVARAEVVAVDTHMGAIDGAGDVAQAINAGAVLREDVLELAEVVAGPHRTGLAPAVFKSVGFALADLTAATTIVRAAAGNLGRSITLH
jgi:ornithine cyclodeaminase/alanine dehydrogenase-like protein (mu-crystallin family)